MLSMIVSNLREWIVVISCKALEFSAWVGLLACALVVGVKEVVN